jgi:hypothetical protein
MKKQDNKSHKSNEEAKEIKVGHIAKIRAPLFDAVIENVWGKKK